MLKRTLSSRRSFLTPKSYVFAEIKENSPAEKAHNVGPSKARQRYAIQTKVVRGQNSYSGARTTVDTLSANSVHLRCPIYLPWLCCAPPVLFIVGGPLMARRCVLAWWRPYDSRAIKRRQYFVSKYGSSIFI